MASNGVPSLLEDTNATNGNVNDPGLNGIVETKICGKKLIVPENCSKDVFNNSEEIHSSTSDSSGNVLPLNYSCSTKASENTNHKMETQGNISCGNSEGYSTGHEDFSGFEGAPVSIEISSPPSKEGVSDDDEYFEEFHLPNTHENAFVRHQSFRKKVNLTPINAPDAERIEGLVRTGSFRRHNSIRKKILHEEQESDFEEIDSVSSLSEQLRQDIEEIEQIILNESQMDKNEDGSKNLVTYSTPINQNGNNNGDTMKSFEFSNLDLTDDSSLLIEPITLKKIKDCLDVTKHKNIYHLSGRLQDILSPQEIEDVLNNSEIYSSFLTAEVLQALSMSLHEMTLSDEESEKRPTNDEQILGKSEDAYKSCASSLDLKVIQAPTLDLNTLDDSESIEVSDIETPNASEFLSSTDILEESFDRTKNQRKISAEGLSFTSVSCYSAPFAESDNHMSPPETSPIGYPLPFSSPDDDLVLPPPPDLIPEADDSLEENHWRNVVIAGDWKRIDMKAVQPYKSFISYGGIADSGSQVIVISAPFLPKRNLKEYNYVMDNLFMYALSILEQLVSEDYILIYFAGGRATSGPGLHWMRRAYDMIDRRIRKNMKQLLIIHPSLWARTLVILSKPFISSKFYRKISFIYSLTDLAQVVSLSSLQIPEVIKQLDFELMISEKKRTKNSRS